jgi:hypothetical protein
MLIMVYPLTQVFGRLYTLPGFMDELLVKYWTRGMMSDKPAASLVCQMDDSHFRLEWIWCPRPWIIRRNGVYFENKTI